MGGTPSFPDADEARRILVANHANEERERQRAEVQAVENCITTMRERIREGKRNANCPGVTEPRSKTPMRHLTEARFTNVVARCNTARDYCEFEWMVPPEPPAVPSSGWFGWLWGGSSAAAVTSQPLVMPVADFKKHYEKRLLIGDQTTNQELLIADCYEKVWDAMKRGKTSVDCGHALSGDNFRLVAKGATEAGHRDVTTSYDTMRWAPPS